MSTVTVDGTLQPDGVTLQLEKKLNLQPGRVMVTVQAADPTAGPTVLEVLERIHRERQQRDIVASTEEEMAAKIAEMRAGEEEYEQRWREIWSQTRSETPAAEQP